MMTTPFQHELNLINARINNLEKDLRTITIIGDRLHNVEREQLKQNEKIEKLVELADDINNAINNFYEGLE